MHDHKCTDCDEPCTPVLEEMGFSYSGTHCTYGRPGFHSDKRWVSHCCLADCEESDDEE